MNAFRSITERLRRQFRARTFSVLTRSRCFLVRLWTANCVGLANSWLQTSQFESSISESFLLHGSTDQKAA